MVALSIVQASNSCLANTLPSGLVAVFVGATSGIGEYALKNFAKHTNSPKVYFVGRSQDAADRIILECQDLNPTGRYIFIKSDVSLLKNVDDVCQQLLAQEDSVNLLFQTQGTMIMNKTSEGLPIAYVLPVTSRILFTLNLLPALQRATSLKRVVTVFAAGYEGPFDDKDWTEYGVKKPLKSRGHLSSMITMANNVMARKAPDVSFVHNYPGAVRTPFGKDVTGGMAVARAAFNFIGRFVIKYLPADESGELQLYSATSAQFPPATGDAGGAPQSKDVSTARGTDGKPGSGSYSINFDCENVSLDIDKHLAKAKAEGAEDKLWAHIINEIKQVTGKGY